MQKFKTKVTINSKSIDHLNSISLQQGTGEHHFFSIELDYDAIEKFGTHSMEASKDLLGKAITITFGDYTFNGLVSDVQLAHSNGSNSNIYVSGYSKTIKLEAGNHLQSWLDKDLSKIVTDVIDQSGIKGGVNPVFKDPIEYESQYNESHFTFLKRLAKQYHEWLYYDGEQLLFGKPKAQKKPIELAYGKELSYLNLSVQTKPRNFSAFSYDSVSDKQHTESSKGSVKGLDEFGNHALKASKEMFNLKTNSHFEGVFNDKSKIEKSLKNLEAAEMADSHTIKANSNRQGLTVGSVVKISAIGFGEGIKPYGEYIIIEIHHEATSEGSYMNTFTAISSNVEILPIRYEIDSPIAQPQLATVKSNEDPKNKGRVQVQLQWQTGQMKTSWIPVLTPDGGKSDKVGVNRGFVFIPEVGDQVMVGFRYSTPNRPFVMGSFFNGKTGSGGSDENKIKSLTTRSGSTITFDDNEGKGKITISDPSGSSITMNGDQTMTLSAAKTISLNAGKSSITLGGDGQLIISGEEVGVSGSKTASLATSSSTFNTEDGKASVNADSVEVNGTNTVTITGTSKATLSSSATTSIEGTIVKLN